MEPVAAELLMALASGTAGAAGQSLWERLRALVRRQTADAVGEGELAALAEDTGNDARARELAAALALRADQDPVFAQALTLWHQEAERVHGAGARDGGDTHQEISGGTQHNVVFTRDVHGPINLN
ncbi:hypothetical protein ACFU6R_04565 [Streptomyces sp. NPDC057499]|uniref:hypothetical protein n=1 Tax=Streptomyces sp. NPDC057499 TaxID=3346150 RepID=UPI003683F486